MYAGANDEDVPFVQVSHHGFRPLPPRGETVSNALIDQLEEDEPEASCAFR